MKALELLIKARELITNPSNWTQGEGARDVNDKPIRSTAEMRCSAVKFCAYGAMGQAAMLLGHDGFHPEYDVARGHLREVCREKYGTPNVSVANDKIEHVEVLSIFDAAIERAVA